MTRLQSVLARHWAIGCIAMLLLLGVASRALAEDRAWMAEFNEVCAKTEIAMNLPAAELETLIARCDQLRTAIEAEDASTRKVYLRRLQQCRDLYRFLLESKAPVPAPSQ